MTALATVASLVVAACGRSAPPNAQADTSGDPEIAGVSITSPDAVVSTVPGAVDTAPSTTVTAETVPAPAAAGTYTVQPGDTLSGIAGRYDLSTDALARANGITDVNSIKPGEQLVIPAVEVEASLVTPPADGAPTESGSTTAPPASP